MKEKELTVEINKDFVEENTEIPVMGRTVLITPPLNDEYWVLRVPVSDDQAIVTFPKFLQWGIGFQHEEEDWNCNLPSRCSARMIFDHISHNKGDDSIPDRLCIKAIELIQKTIKDTGMLVT